MVAPGSGRCAQGGADLHIRCEFLDKHCDLHFVGIFVFDFCFPAQIIQTKPERDNELGDRFDHLLLELRHRFQQAARV